MKYSTPFLVVFHLAASFIWWWRQCQGPPRRFCIGLRTYMMSRKYCWSNVGIWFRFGTASRVESMERSISTYHHHHRRRHRHCSLYLYTHSYSSGNSLTLTGAKWNDNFTATDTQKGKRLVRTIAIYYWLCQHEATRQHELIRIHSVFVRSMLHTHTIRNGFFLHLAFTMRQ